MQAAPTRSGTSTANPLVQYLLITLGILALAGLAGVAAYVLTSRQTPLYQASGKLLADASSTIPNGLTVGIVFNSPNLEPIAYREAALSQEVIIASLKGLGANTDDRTIRQFRGKASIAVTTGSRAVSDVFTLRFVDSDPEQARKYLNAWMQAMLEWDDEFVRKRIRTYIKDFEAQYKSLAVAERQLRSAQVSDEERAQFRQARGNVFKDIQLFKGLESSVQGSLRLMEEPNAARTPIAPRPARSAAMVAFVVAVVLVGLWFLYLLWLERQKSQGIQIDL